MKGTASNVPLGAPEHRGAGRRIYDLRTDADVRVLDDDDHKHILALSQELVIQFHTLFRSAHFHSFNNQAVRQHLDRFIDAIRQLFAQEYEIHVEYTGTDFLVNERWTRLSRQLQDLSNKVGQLFIERELGGFRITAKPEPEQVIEFLELFRSVGAGTQAPFAQLQSRLRDKRVDWLELERYEPPEVIEHEQLESRVYVRQTYLHAIDVAKQLYQQAADLRSLKLISAKRVVQAFVDIFLGSHAQAGKHYLLLLTQIRNWLDYGYNHAVNVSILSIGFAHALGFERSSLRDIGIAGLLYDIGMARLPEELSLQLDLTSEQRKTLMLHPVFAVPAIVNTTVLDSTVVRSTNVAFSHHLWLTEGGYPEFGHGAQSLATQLIAICDQYDGLTTSRPHRPRAMPQPDALAELVRSSNQRLDPIVIRKFVDWMGPLPLGTVVGLRTGQLGYVLTPVHRPRDRLRPIIKVILPRTRNGSEVINLAETDRAGRLVWEITHVADASDPRVKKALIDDLLR